MNSSPDKAIAFAYGSVTRRLYLHTVIVASFLLIVISITIWASNTLTMITAITRFERTHTVSRVEAMVAFFEYVDQRKPEYLESFHSKIAITQSYNKVFSRLLDMRKDTPDAEFVRILESTFSETDHETALIIVNRIKVLYWNPILRDLVANAVGANAAGERLKIQVAQFLATNNETEQAVIEAEIHKTRNEFISHETSFSKSCSDLSNQIASYVNYITIALLIISAAFTGLLSYLIANAVIREAARNTLILEKEVLERKRSEHSYRTMFDSAPEGVWMIGQDRRTTEVNQRMCDLVGYTHEEMIGRNPVELADQENAKTFEEKARIVPNRQTRTYEVALRHRDGHNVPTEFRVTHLFNEDGSVMGVLAFVTDLTERKQAEEKAREGAQALLASEARHAAMVANISDVIGIMGVDGLMTYKSPNIEKYFGWKPSDLVGTDGWLTVHPDDLTGMQQAFYALLKEDNSSTTVLYRYLCKDGSYKPIELTATNLTKDPSVCGVLLNYRDITERKNTEEEIRNLAFSDPLTGLPNRRLLMDRLEQAMASATRHGHQGALLFVDLDDFKTLNDTLGHDKGDLLLKHITQRLITCVREGDTVARLGGDEFVVLLEDLSEDAQDAATQAQTVGGKIHDALGQPYQLNGHGHHSTASIGVTLFGGAQRENIEEPLKRAELAMYQAKRAGRNTLRFFEPEMRTAVNTRATLEADLRQAVTRGQFLLYYQPQCSGDRNLLGVEALVRWQHPERGLVSPVEFIPVAETSGLILPLGRWVLKAACQQLATWAARPGMADLTMSVNVSAREFRQPDFVEEVVTILEATGADPMRLKLELTESVLVDNVEDIIFKMNALKDKGVCFSLDDFGTGYSSLSYLKRLPLDQLKIDQGFVRDILTDPNDAAIAKMVVVLATTLGLAVIAEGVETEQQRWFLASMGCDNYQGYLFSKPLTIEEFEVFARDR